LYSLPPKRCPWCGTDPLYVAYHDEEWGVPEWDSRALYEKLVLDGFQAGLAWITILRKRDAFRSGFAGFRPEIVASWGEPEVVRLLGDAEIVRHRGKIEAAIDGARAWLRIEEREGFDRFVWKFVDGRPVQTQRGDMSDIPAQTETSVALSRALKAEGFRFCGPTIVYAFMQAVGMVNDHITRCPRHAQVAAMAPA
jgi:DNA-3-methyladenine glycosylase I